MKTETIKKKGVSKLNLALIFVSSGIISYYAVTNFILDKPVSKTLLFIGLLLFLKSTRQFFETKK